MAIITIKKDALEYEIAQGITVPHCFTTRLGGVSKNHLSSLNLGIRRGDDPENVVENFRILGEAVGFSLEDLVGTRQVHSDIVWKVGRAQRGTALTLDSSPECDALITNEPGTALVVYTADCTPLLLHDPVTGAVGAVHAGWKGTAAAIGEKTVQAMVAAYGCDPANIRAAIGPNIGFCHFETDRDVPDAMLQTYGQDASAYIRSQGSKYYVNLKEMNALSLRRAGVRHIEISDSCTMCQPDRFWSHRVTRGMRGTQGAVILCKEGNR